ncbi:MAG: hypothetical protein V1725_00900 [archaeon]
MKIAICGSMHFAKEMLHTKQSLEDLGHEVIVPQGTIQYSIGERSAEHKWDKLDRDVIREYYERIKEQDAILILNHTKNNIPNYVGGNALIEMAFAHVLHKNIYLLNPIPQLAYTDEIAAMHPFVLSGDLRRI